MRPADLEGAMTRLALLVIAGLGAFVLGYAGAWL